MFLTLTLTQKHASTTFSPVVYPESHNAQRYRQSDGQRDDNVMIMSIADHTVQQYDRLKMVYVVKFVYNGAITQFFPVL